MSSKTSFWIFIAVLLFIVGVFIYLASAGQVNIISDAEHPDAQKRRLAESRLKELEPEMEKNLALKKKLDRYVMWGFIGVKLILVAAVVGICLFVKYLFGLSLDELYEWKDKALCFIGICVFIISGTEIKFFKAYPWMRDMVKVWVYKKYKRPELEKEITEGVAEIKQWKEIIATLPEPQNPVQ